MNKAILIGNLTSNPELRTTQGGVSVCSFGLAVNRRRKVEGQADVDFFNVTTWRQLADNCAKYLSKGKKACVEGSIQIRTYEGRDGVKRMAAEIDAVNVEFLAGVEQGGLRQKRDEFTPLKDNEDIPF